MSREKSTKSPLINSFSRRSLVKSLNKSLLTLFFCVRTEDSQSTQRKRSNSSRELTVFDIAVIHSLDFVRCFMKRKERESENEGKIIKYLTHHKLINELS